jgi:hypothetical protein
MIENYIKNLKDKSMINKFIKSKQRFIMITNYSTDAGSFLKKGSTFSIDAIEDDNIYIHFRPYTDSSIVIKFNEEKIPIEKLFEIADKCDWDLKELAEENEFLKYCIDNNTENLLKMAKQLREVTSENEFLKEKNEKLNDICFDTMQENATMDNHIKIIEQDYYNTYKLDKKEYCDMMDKLTDERNTYKEVIKVMCDKYNISHDSVFEIIDDIQENKNNQLEK